MIVVVVATGESQHASMPPVPPGLGCVGRCRPFAAAATYQRALEPNIDFEAERPSHAAGTHAAPSADACCEKGAECDDEEEELAGETRCHSLRVRHVSFVELIVRRDCMVHGCQVERRAMGRRRRRWWRWRRGRVMRRVEREPI